MRVIDLRSDTVTHPTPAMREAMCQAEVGDDVYGEDPTVNQLERRAAERLGKEAALFVASGTMGNLVALLAHCWRGDEVIIGDRTHMCLFEQGGMSALGGIMPHVLPNQPDGTLRLDDIEQVIRGNLSLFQPRPRLVCLENTHNSCNATPLPALYAAQVARLAHDHGLFFHLDGARIFHASVALGVDVRALAQEADSVMFCLSKGLCAPVGSMLCGSTDFIAEARRMRQVVGGGLRQAGVLAAAGIVALEQMTDRLGEDHARAKRLARGLAGIRGVEVEPAPTNMVFFRLTEEASKTSEEVERALADEGILVLGAGLYGRFRAVTHYWISDQDIEKTISVMTQLLQ